MANTCAAMGFASKMIVEPGASPHTFDASSERYAFTSENLKAVKKLQGRTKITGSRSQFDAYLRKSTYLVRGNVVIQPGPADLSLWLPRILYGTPSGSSYPMGTEPPSFGFLLHKENGVFQVTDAVVNAAVFRSASREGADGGHEEFIELVLNIIGITETNDDVTWPVSEPALAFTSNRMPFMHWEGAFVLDGTSVAYRNFALTINNMLKPLYYNSITPNCVRSMGRSVTLETENPFIEDNLGLAIDTYETGAPGTLTFTSGAMSTVFTMPLLRNNYETPSVLNKGEIPLKLELEATASATNNELTVTHDATP